MAPKVPETFRGIYPSPIYTCNHWHFTLLPSLREIMHDMILFLYYYMQKYYP
jgi:hypothetical protein